MKIVYLHGLESNNLGPKNDWLKSNYDIFDPYVDYHESNIYQNLKSKISVFEPDLIIGSSMGGYFAHEIAKELNVNAILFNPALHSRSFEPDINGHSKGKYKPKIYLVLGENDIVINPLSTIDFIKKEGNINYTYALLSHEHGTSFELFKKEIIFFIEQNLNVTPKL
ncbi:YqiA/YcfP family alpha/beta fold hydrolase [uncultured Flavobacterium sp.]|uniref:YqiA/YcfP family alpha/beta fold hydrolase n=1 Tax=uncultured Flavobacterium sp. TaxID=165435 RepID=UPI0030EB6792|tara:strand:- start:28176 stop:28676 length:501 start_codon:yes stop_codon:yes gene_type:complete